MVARAALTLGLALAGLAAPFQEAEQVPRSEERAPYERLDLPSVAACGACHVQVAREWSESLHARAWVNANVRRATRDFERESCRPCHSPRPVFETGFDRPPAYRPFNREDGVHCLSCHGLGDGVAAARTIPDAPCRPRREPRLLAADHCYPCHQPTHQAFDEYRQSQAFADGIRCVDCHMPERADGTGRSHGPHGGMNAEFVAGAIAWEARREEDGVHLRLRNRTGHKFPGEIPSRSFRIQAVIEPPGATQPESWSTVLRKPHRGEDREDDRLRPDEEREIVIPAGRAAAVTVQLRFASLPLLRDEDAFLLGTYRSEGER